MKNTINDILEKYLTMYPDEKQRQQTLLTYLKNNDNEDIIDWNNFNGHIVASGFVYAKRQNKFLMLYHKDLNMYLYPGGHVNVDDDNILEAAIREVKEETGLIDIKQLQICNDKLVPIDIDTHEIGYNERLKLPKHYHFDFRYFFIVDSVKDINIDIEEHTEYKWISAEEFAKNKDYDRVLDKFFHLFELASNSIITMNAHDNIAKKYYKAYKDDKSDLEYIDKFLERCNHKILDLGCGMGHYSKYMQSKGYEVIGVDFSKEMLKIARETTENIKYIEADICELPEDIDKDFDGVLIAYVLQHLSKEETAYCLLDLKKYIIKNSNILIFLREGNSVLKEKEPFNPNFEYTIKEYTNDEIVELLEEYGYEIISVENKPFIDDDNSLCPKTLVIYARIK